MMTDTIDEYLKAESRPYRRPSITEPDKDESILCAKRDGTLYVCELPSGLGNMTELEVRDGRLIVQTESNVTFIGPLF